MSKSFQAIKGTKDLLPVDTARWRKFEAVIHETMNQWGFGEIRTPIFEKTELFSRSAPWWVIRAPPGGKIDMVCPDHPPKYQPNPPTNS